MPKLRQIDSFYSDYEHTFDDYKNLGYNYEMHIMKNVISPELFSNPVNDTTIRQIERLVEQLINTVKHIKLAYAYAFPKNSKLIN